MNFRYICIPTAKLDTNGFIFKRVDVLNKNNIFTI